MKFDDVLREIGEFGWYQRRVYLLACLPIVFIAFEALGTVFIFNIPKHRCQVPDFPDDDYHVTNTSYLRVVNRTIPREDGEWSSCYIYSDVSDDFVTENISDVSEVTGEEGRKDNNSRIQEAVLSKCHQWVYDRSVFQSTVATEFDVVCDRTVLRSASNMWAEAGTLLGTLVAGFIADRFGRRLPFYLGAVALIGGGFGIAFTTSLISINVCRFILGMARNSLWTNGFVIAMEIVGPSKRVFAGVMMELAWCLGMFLLAVFAFFIRNWRYLEIAVSVPACFLLAYWWLMPESPRWLASRGREKEALRILEKITSSNKTSLPKTDDVTKSLMETETQLSFRFIFKSRELIVRMLIIFSNMFILCVIYYALLYNITNLAGDIFTNYLIGVALETVGLVTPYFLLDRLGRKSVYCTSVVLGGAVCVVSVVPALLGSPDWVVTALSMVGRFFVCVAFSTIFVYAAELFPTVIRASAMGLGVTFSRIGSLISPYIADVGVLTGGRLSQALPLVVMGSPSLIVGLFSLWLPETKGSKLPETLDDVNNLQSKRGCFCCQKLKHNEKRGDHENYN